MIYAAKTIADMLDAKGQAKVGFALAPWCGDLSCELAVKEKAGLTSRCIPFDKQLQPGDKCVCCGKPAKHLVYWGKQY